MTTASTRTPPSSAQRSISDFGGRDGRSQRRRRGDRRRHGADRHVRRDRRRAGRRHVHRAQARRPGQLRGPGRRARPRSRLLPRLHRPDAGRGRGHRAGAHAVSRPRSRACRRSTTAQAPVKTSNSDGGAAFAATNSGQNGTPATPMLKAYVGDPVQVHALVTPGSEQMHVFSLGGESWPLDPFITGSNLMQARGIGPWETLQATIARWGRRRRNRRRPVLRRSAPPVHRRQACGASSA